VLAGHETSASTLTWAFYELTLDSNRELLVKLLNESNSVFDDCRETSSSDTFNTKNKVVKIPNKEKINALIYSECCLRESLRKYSVVPTVVRVADEDIELNGYQIKKKDTLMLNLQGVHHNESFWPQPSRYIPDRFLKEIEPYTFLAFIDGPRRCLGQYLSLLETKIILSALLSSFHFKLVDEQKSSFKHQFMVPIVPKHGIFVKVY
jgi:cytochrome P450